MAVIVLALKRLDTNIPPVGTCLIMWYNRYMPWRGNTFYYTKRLLRTIAENYICLYEGLPSRWGDEITNPWALAEYKADFDMALSSIGKGKWAGMVAQFTDYRHFGRLQQIIIADILGVDDYTLEAYGFYDVPRLRGFAYYLMVKYLNGG